MSVAKSPPATDHEQLTADKSTIETQAIAALSTEFSQNPKRYFRRVAELVAQAAEALEHAHEQGILHRDVKPANLLLDFAGKLYITDFGLARIEAESRLSVTRDLVGTLRYMAPEQVAGTPALVDFRTDLHALGATLFELVALRPAFDGADRGMLLHKIAETAPPRLRQLDPGIPADLETIVGKAMEKDPADRYQSAGEMAADLRAFAASRAIAARRPSAAARARKCARRHPAFLVSAVLVLAVSLVVSLAAAGVAQAEKDKTAEALDDARMHLQEANAQRQRAEQNFRFALEAVDEMYTQLATEWLASETAPSTLQQDFLARAAQFYDQAAQQAVGDPSQREFLALAWARSGQIAGYLQQYDAALERLQNSVGLGEELLAEEPASRDRRAALLPRYRLLADVRRSQGDLRAADKASLSGLKHAETLLHDHPGDMEHRRERAEFQLDRAAILADYSPEHYLKSAETAGATDPVTGHFELAADLARTAREALRELRVPNAPPRLVARRTDADLVLARILHYQGDFQGAAETAEEALKQCRFQRTNRYGDYRPLAVLKAALVEQLGETAESVGNPEEALEHYTASLDLQRSLLKTGQEPDLFMIRSFLGPDGGGDANFEPVPFIRYVETQLRQARILEKLGLPYAAEDALGQAHLASMIVVSDNFRVLRFHVAHANAWAMAASLLADRRPNESKQLVAHAADLWRDALAEFPQAADYHSGVHGSFADWTWFRVSFPVLAEQVEHQARQAQGAGAGEERLWQVLNLPNDTAFTGGAAARGWFRAKLWDEAIRFLRKAADAHESVAAYSWLHLAMAHAELGQHEDAAKWYDQASDAIDKADPPEPELIAFRDHAKQLLANRKEIATTSSGD